MQAMIERVLEMCLEAQIMSIRDALGRRERASWGIHLEALIDCDWRAWRRSIGGALDAETLSNS